MKKLPMFSSAEAVEEAFYDALERGDLNALMCLWADDDDVISIHPGGPRASGLEAVRHAWTEVLAGPLDIRATSVHRIQSMSTAVHSVIEEIAIEGEQSREIVRCVATNVYVKDAQGWRIILHHASPAGEEQTVPTSEGILLH